MQYECLVCSGLVTTMTLHVQGLSIHLSTDLARTLSHCDVVCLLPGLSLDSVHIPSEAACQSSPCHISQVPCPRGDTGNLCSYNFSLKPLEPPGPRRPTASSNGIINHSGESAYAKLSLGFPISLTSVLGNAFPWVHDSWPQVSKEQGLKDHIM